MNAINVILYPRKFDQTHGPCIACGIQAVKVRRAVKLFCHHQQLYSKTRLAAIPSYYSHCPLQAAFGHLVPRAHVAMGRKANPLVDEFFERGAKIEDKSNRYEHTCKKCGAEVRLCEQVVLSFRIIDLGVYSLQKAGPRLLCDTSGANVPA